LALWEPVFFLPVVAVQTMLILGITYLVAALNVAFRDLQHIVGNVLLMGFFLTPIVWPIADKTESVRQLELYGNPMAALVTAYRAIFLEHAVPAAKPLVVVAGVSLIVLWLSSGVFERRREEFAEMV
jgi:lipopolysaccharide transport system permease protein